VSILRDAFERRSVVNLQDQYQQAGLYPDSQGSWGPGMVWKGQNNVSIDQSMRLSAVFACLRLLSEAISTLPLDTFSRSNGQRRPYRPRPEYLSFNPPQGSRIDYVSQVMLSLLTNGNAYVLTPRDRLGVPVNLIVLDPTQVTVSRVHGKVTYTCQSIPLIPDLDIMHIKGMCMPGAITGLSPVSYAREAVGLGLAAQRFGEAFFDNGALPGAVIEAPGDMTKEAAERFRDTWNGSHQGVGNAHRVGVLTGGATLSKVSVSPNDSQFLETRQFQVPDVARIFGVPPHLIADASNSTSWGSGLAEQNLAFGQFSLRPWVDRFEEAHGRLLTSHGLPDVFIKLNMDALLRASLTDRYAAYQVGVTNHIDTINEVRALEDKPPVPWGNEPFIPTKVTETGPASAQTLGLPTQQAPAGGKP
jgi:HK97 family phage portal protein